MTLTRVAVGIFSAFIVARQTVLMSVPNDDAQLAMLVLSLSVLLWLGLKGFWLTVVGGVAALVALGAFGLLLDQALREWSNFSISSSVIYRASLVLAGSTIGALCFWIRDGKSDRPGR